MAPLLAIRRRGCLENRHDPALFALRDLRKDLDLAVDLFGRSSAITPLTAIARDLIAAEAGTSPDLDITAAIRLYRGLEIGSIAEQTGCREHRKRRPGTRR